MTFILQILHTSDPEGRVDAVENAPNFAAIVDYLETEQENSITLSSGDNLIPGPFFYAAGNRAAFRDSGLFNSIYNTLFNLPADVDGDGTVDAYAGLREGGGRVDISILNIIGFDASTVGQHEFDLGSSAFASFLAADFQGVGLADDRWVGTQFPYLSANLDFSEDVALADLFTDEILPNTAFQTDPSRSLAGESGAPKLAAATIIERSGEQIGVVGVSTPLLERVSSPTGTTVRNPGAGTEDMTALATILQPVIDDLRAGADNTLDTEDDLNKVILLSHLQNLALDQELIGLLEGVDVVVAGGSGTLLADETDVLREGDVPADTYPLSTTNADGEPALIVSANPEYSYVGRLVVTFDDNGIIDTTALDASLNGVIATTDAGIAAIAPDADLFAPGTKGAEVRCLTDAVSEIFLAQDSQTFGKTEVFLEARVQAVRTQETNLGNLSSDANLAIAQAFDPTVQVSIRNAGGIRAPIGQVSDDGELLPPQENPAAGKSTGEISQLDIESSLQFNNGLSLLTVTAAELEILIEHGVSATEPGALPGQFPQVSSLAFSFDPNRPAPEDLNGNQVLDENEDQNGNGILDLGERVRSLAIVDAVGTVVDVIVRDGELVGDPNREIRLVTLDFLANGGDDYPFDIFGNDREDLTTVLTDEGAAQGAAPGTEQDALAEFLAANFADTPFNMAETPIEADTRIQNLAFRTDTVLGESSNNVTIINSGFEDPVVEDGIFTFTTPPGWELFDPDGLIPLPTNSVGVWNPTVSNHPDGVPEGENVGFIFLGEPPGSGTVALTQTLTTTLEANTQYTLAVKVGDPLPNPGSSALDGFPGYEIQLLAGDTVLVLDNNSLEITEGTFETSVISFTAPEDHPNLGEALEIRLFNLLEEEGEIVNFDDVRVELSGIVINGTNQKDTLTGGAGDDTISGGNGKDELFGLAGDDILGGDNGFDILNGGLGNDTLTGGNGPDLFVLAADEGTDTITDFSNPDSIGLSGSIGFSDLSFFGNDIILTSTNEVLATLTGVDTTTLTSSDFTTV